MCADVEGRFDSEDEDDAKRAELEPAEHKRNAGDKCWDHVCWTGPEMKTQESQVKGVSVRQGFATTRRDGSRHDQARIPEKHTRFGG